MLEMKQKIQCLSCQSRDKHSNALSSLKTQEKRKKGLNWYLDKLFALEVNVDKGLSLKSGLVRAKGMPCRQGTIFKISIG